MSGRSLLRRAVGKLIRLDAVGKANFSAAALAAALIFALVFYNSYATVARYFFNKPPAGSHEISTYLIPVIVFLGLAYTLEMKRHIIVDTLIRRLKIRNQLVLNVITTLIVAVLAAILVWKGTELALSKFHQTSGSYPPFPLFPFYIFVPIGSLLLLLQSIRNVRTYLISLTRKG